MGIIARIKTLLGCLVFDVPHYLRHLNQNKYAWVAICNRHDKLISHINHIGVKCDWQWTSDLYLPTVLPSFGESLFKKALADFPIEFAKQPVVSCADKPDIAFIIGHRGIEREPLLLKTIDSIAAQKNCAIECIVVEQNSTSTIRDSLPEWVTYKYTPTPSDTPYSRARAFNEGARVARADCIILHDNDLLIPSNYAQETHKLYLAGFDFINLKRFIFYLSKHACDLVLTHQGKLKSSSLESIMQNAQGGGSIGASRAAFFEIGGFDERFVGWGGEDNEFWERAETRNSWHYGFLPLVHLWHPQQATKNLSNAVHKDNLYWTLTQQTPQERIEHLNARKPNPSAS